MVRQALKVGLAAILLVVAGVMLVRALDRLLGDLRGSTPGELPAGVAERPPEPASAAPARVALERVADGLTRPLFVTHAGDGSGRLFVVEQGGGIHVLAVDGSGRKLFLDAGPLLDESGGERGLLGLAFPPDHGASGRFFIAHTAPGPTVRITRLEVSGDPDAADPRTATLVLEMEDPAANHNGGMIAFGPDGFLWIGTGDGGRGGDPWDNARNPDSLLGKILRIDVRDEPYSIPGDNPFAAGRGRPEVWALGLRNPWRFSFDRVTGELWTGDVGQNAWEEIDVEDPKAGGGRHYGWKTMEGRHCFDPPVGCDPAGLLMPIHEYGHDLGCSVTGGYVYRGRAIPSLVGAYLFADYCRGTVWTLVRAGDGTVAVATLLETGRVVSSFGEDEAGEVYLCDHTGGVVERIVASPS